MNVQLDWLQIGAKGIMNFNSDDEIYVREETKGTRHFRRQGDVIFIGEKVGVISWAPYSKVLAPDLHIFKLQNEKLYTQNPFKFTRFLMNKLFLKINNVTRIDLAVDFNTFYNNLKPENFISGVVKENPKYIKKGRAKFKLQGELGNYDKRTEKHFNTYEYLRCGSNDSAISVYLYNKTKEMTQMVFKPYIFKSWENNQLDTDQDIWRLEVSLKRLSSQRILDQESGLLTEISFNNLENNPEILKNAFSAGINQIFSFLINNRCAQKRTMKELVFFKSLEFDANKIIVDYNNKDSSKRDRVAMNYLDQAAIDTSNEVRLNKKQREITARIFLDAKNEIAKKANMDNYRRMKETQYNGK